MVCAVASILLASLIGVDGNGIAAGPCHALDGPGFNESLMYLNKFPVEDNSAVCNDGSAAQMYYRPCCEGQTAGDFCNESDAIWMIVFGDGNQDGWCWDEVSCAQRMSESPNLTGSQNLDPYFSRWGEKWGSEVGAFCKIGEVNQNFGKISAVYVPYCSSDLFMGECEGNDGEGPHFCGKNIAKAAIRTLLPFMEKYNAEDIILAGGAGVMTYVEELRAMLPSSARVSALCDGCVLFDEPASEAVSRCSGADAFSCTPDATLPAAVELWNASLQSWRSLLSNATAGATAHAASQMNLLAQHPQYDDKSFSARGTSAADADASLLVSVRARILAGLQPASVKVSSSCTQPQSSFLYPEFFSVQFEPAFFPPPSFAIATHSLYLGQEAVFMDRCQGVNCNDHCNLTASTDTFIA